jgi:hypothetical protein
MDKPTLEYAPPERPPSPLPLIAAVCGVVSAPVGYGLVWLLMQFVFPMGSAVDQLALIVFFAPPVFAFMFGLAAWDHCEATGRTRVFAVIGWAAPVAWVFVLFVLFFFLVHS